jgi:predicted  nucleic acid-binding Zn-ribbon protein
MSELETPSRSISGALIGVIAAALLIAVGGLVWTYTLSTHLSHQETALMQANEQNARLAADLRETNARLKVTTDEMGRSLGLTQKQLEAKSQEILEREQVDSQRLEKAQKAANQQITAVNSAVTDVKTDVGGVKTDVAKTQSDLATAVGQLQSIQGDVSGHTSLIARNHDELEVLKHKGDRNFYEFTLVKGQKKPVGTVSLELKKADAKKSRYTLTVFSDDKSYEKKDRNLNEPLQFYGGKDPSLYEIVVNSVSAKNTVTGYLSVPKTAPVPPTVSSN